MSAELRLVHLQSGSPSWNMAVDQALLLTEGSPLLRFYSWQPFGLSLGHFQDELPDEERKRFEDQGIEVVRRLTGGGAILHAHELTYSLTGRDGEGLFAGGVEASYRLVHDVICALLKARGLEAKLAVDAPPALKKKDQPFLCFARSTALDIVVDGRKIVGSAKRRREGRALQHGSIVLRGDAPGGAELGIEDLLGHPLDLDSFQDEFARGLAARAGLELVESELPAEIVTWALRLRHL